MTSSTWYQEIRSMKATILSGRAAEERVAALGADITWFHGAVQAGELARDLCGPLMPPNYAGLAVWAHRIERLRALALPHGWKPINVRNMPMVESPNGQVAVVCITGDHGVGLEYSTPKTRNDRGPVTESALDRNVEQLSFFHLLTGLIETHARLDHPFTFVLLSHRAGSIVRCELSLPLALDEDHRVSAWVERNLLSPVDLTPVGVRPQSGPDDRFDVDVRRKSS